MLTWIPEQQPRWTPTRRAMLAGAGIVAPDGAELTGRWWAVTRDGELLGYGRLLLHGRDAEVTVAVADQARGTGIGAWIFERLRDEAEVRGLEALKAHVPLDHPHREDLSRWLLKCGFEPSADGHSWRSEVALFV